MKKSLFTCDKCGITSVSSRYQIPHDWEKISYTVHSYNLSKEYHLCTTCSKELKIRTEAKFEIKHKDIAERLLEIITEIVGMNQ